MTSCCISKITKEKNHDITDTYTLNNGIKIPKVGFGTWQSASGEEAYNAVKAALEAGYRHIDTAAVYKMKNQSVKQLLIKEFPVRNFSLQQNFGV